MEIYSWEHKIPVGDLEIDYEESRDRKDICFIFKPKFDNNCKRFQNISFLLDWLVDINCCIKDPEENIKKAIKKTLKKTIKVYQGLIEAKEQEIADYKNRMGILELRKEAFFV